MTLRSFLRAALYLAGTALFWAAVGFALGLRF